jgi:hypothetical protein
VGGMGARGANFYTDTVAALGWEDAAHRIQDRYLAGDRAAAVAAVPDDMLEALTLCGTAAEIRTRLAALRHAGVTTIIARPSGQDPAVVIAGLRTIVATLDR